MTTPPPYITPKAVARYLGVSAMTVYRLIDAGSLPAVRIGKVFRISSRDLARYIAENTTADLS